MPDSERLNKCEYQTRTPLGWKCSLDGTFARKKGDMPCYEPGVPADTVNECAQAATGAIPHTRNMTPRQFRSRRLGGDGNIRNTEKKAENDLD